MNEEKRISALHATQLLDTAPEDKFNRLVRLAANSLDVDVAIIALVDSDRTWFKARVGCESDEIPREQSFCNHAINTPYEVMVVANAAEDERFANFPMVTKDPKLLFYAGAPLVTKCGQAIGALCVLDDEPHYDFTEADKQILTDLAAMVIAQIEGMAQSRDIEDLTLENEVLILENEDLSIVNEELQHRMGNMYAHVSALVSMMSNTSVNKDLFTKRLRSKISVLAETQALLAARSWSSVPISELVDTALAPFRNSSKDKRIVVDLSEDFLVSPRGVFILTLMLNELGTNAVKHGALKTINGKVKFSCKNNGILEFTWDEEVSPECEILDNPEGFGTLILEQIVPMDLHGDADHVISATGLHYHVTAQAERICIC